MTDYLQLALWQWVSCLVLCAGISCSMRYVWQAIRSHRGKWPRLGHLMAARLYQILAQSGVVHKHLCLCCKWMGRDVWVLIDSGATHSITSVSIEWQWGTESCCHYTEYSAMLPAFQSYSAYILSCCHSGRRRSFCGLWQVEFTRFLVPIFCPAGIPAEGGHSADFGRCGRGCHVLPGTLPSLLPC